MNTTLTPSASPAEHLAAAATCRDQRAFNAAVFRTNADGTPFLNKAGLYMPRGGRKPKSAAVTGSKSAAPGTSRRAEPVPDLSDIEAAAQPDAASPEDTAAGIAAGEVQVENLTAETLIGIFQTALVLIGEDEGVLTRGEKIMLRSPLEQVLAKYDVGEDALPPEVNLAVAMAVVVIARLRKPKTATFFAKARAFCMRLFWRGKGEQLRRRVARETGAIGEETNRPDDQPQTVGGVSNAY